HALMCIAYLLLFIGTRSPPMTILRSSNEGELRNANDDLYTLDSIRFDCNRALPARHRAGCNSRVAGYVACRPTRPRRQPLSVWSVCRAPGLWNLRRNLGRRRLEDSQHKWL